MENAFDFNPYPHAAGYKGTDTSADAARDITPETFRLRRLALRVLDRAGDYGATSEEAAELAGVPRCSIQPKYSELRRLGKIVDSGKRRVNASSGKRAAVWVLPQYKEGSNDLPFQA